MAMGRKYEIISSILKMDLLERIKMLLDALNISSPFKDKPLIEQEKIIKQTLNSGSTAANPKEIGRSDVEFILHELF
jgi:alcohol dehydrogenase class IV